jgi:hypothetical protein
MKRRGLYGIRNRKPDRRKTGYTRVAKVWTEDDRTPTLHYRITIECNHDWQEQPGEPPVDVCPKCGASRE